MSMNSGAFVTSSVLNVVIQTALEFKIDTQQALLGTGITPEQLARDNYFHTYGPAMRLVKNCADQAGMGYAEFALLCGTRGNLNSYGPAGLAAMSEKYLGDAINVAIQYLATVNPSFEITLSENPVMTTIGLHPRFPMPEQDLKIAICYYIGSVKQMLKTLIGVNTLPSLEFITLHLPFPEIPFLKTEQDLSKATLKFDAEHCFFELPTIAMRFPLAFKNAYMAERFKEECDALLSESATGYAAQVAQLLDEAEFSFPSFDQIAEKLNVSPRSLSRSLAEEGCSYRAILSDLKMGRALKMLEERKLSITQISTTLGYSETATFTKAFKARFGVVPSKYSGYSNDD